MVGVEREIMSCMCRFFFLKLMQAHAHCHKLFNWSVHVMILWYFDIACTLLLLKLVNLSIKSFRCAHTWIAPHIGNLLIESCTISLLCSGIWGPSLTTCSLISIFLEDTTLTAIFLHQFSYNRKPNEICDASMFSNIVSFSDINPFLKSSLSKL